MDAEQRPGDVGRVEAYPSPAAGGSEGSDLFKVGSVYDEDSSTVLTWFGRGARIAEYVDHRVHVVFLCADEQRDVTAAQEAAGAGDAGYTVAVGDQLFDDRPGI